MYIFAPQEVFCNTCQFEWQVADFDISVYKYSTFIFGQTYAEVVFWRKRLFVEPVGSEFVTISIFVIIP